MRFLSCLFSSLFSSSFLFFSLLFSHQSSFFSFSVVFSAPLLYSLCSLVFSSLLSSVCLISSLFSSFCLFSLNFSSLPFSSVLSSPLLIKNMAIYNSQLVQSTWTRERCDDGPRLAPLFTFLALIPGAGAYDRELSNTRLR